MEGPSAGARACPSSLGKSWDLGGQEEERRKTSLVGQEAEAKGPNRFSGKWNEPAAEFSLGRQVGPVAHLNLQTNQRPDHPELFAFLTCSLLGSPSWLV